MDNIQKENLRWGDIMIKLVGQLSKEKMRCAVAKLPKEAYQGLPDNAKGAAYVVHAILTSSIEEKVEFINEAKVCMIFVEAQIRGYVVKLYDYCIFADGDDTILLYRINDFLDQVKGTIGNQTGMGYYLDQLVVGSQIRI